MVCDVEADRVGVVADRLVVAEKVRGAADKVKVAEDKARVVADRLVVADNVVAVWEGLPQQVPAASASVRNAVTVNRTNAALHAHRNSARSAEHH